MFCRQQFRWFLHLHGGMLMMSMLILTGCSTHLSQLQDAKPKANTFADSLAAEYLDYANAESEQQDWFDAEHFAKKGLQALRGETVLPEEVAERQLLPVEKLTLEKARKKLLTVLNDHTKSVVPQTAARAQMLFDCWLEQMEEHGESMEVATCGQEFRQTLAELKEVPGSTESLIPHFEIFFDVGSAELDEKDKKVFARVARVARSLKSCEVQLTGHTDRLGSGKRNLALAQARVEAVEQALKKYKLCGGKISAVAAGESSPRVLVPNGVAEALNRRVDIDIQGEDR